MLGAASRIGGFALLAALGVAGPAGAEWQFAIPSGWVDLSPGKPVPKEVPRSVSAMAQGGKYHTYAMDLAGRSDGFATNLNAIIGHAPLVANDESLRQFVNLLPTQAQREVPGSTVTVIEQSIVEIQGVPSLRVVADVKTARLTIRVVKYAIPGGREVAGLTYATTPKAYERYLPLIEAAAAQTQGAAAAPALVQFGAKLRALAGGSLSGEDWKTLFGAVGSAIGAAIGIAIAVFVARAKRRGVGGVG